MAGTSGLDGNKSEAVELLWAGLLDNSLTRAEHSRLQKRYEETEGGAPFSDVSVWLRALAKRFPLPIDSAIRTPPSVNGDVDAIQPDGSVLKFEVKAQVKKPAFRDITQSDWIRDQTDLLSWLVANDSSIRTHFRLVGARELARVRVSPPWDQRSLHIADLAGVTNRNARANAGITSPRGLQSFIDRKWFLHVTEEGARLCQFSDIAPIRHLLAGGRPAWETKINPAGRALLSLDSPSGKAWFTYHLYPATGVRGRHKMHEAAFAGVTWI